MGGGQSHPSALTADSPGQRLPQMPHPSAETPWPQPQESPRDLPGHTRATPLPQNRIVPGYHWTEKGKREPRELPVPKVQSLNTLPRGPHIDRRELPQSR